MKTKTPASSPFVNYVKRRDDTEKSTLIRYKEAYDILHTKYGVNHDELRYLFKKINSGLPNYVHDTDLKNKLDVSSYPNSLVDDNFEYIPQNLFYDKEWVENLEIKPARRFVYYPDLKFKRMWNDHDGEIQRVLESAGKQGILRWYDLNKDNFTYYKEFGKEKTKVSWAKTDEGLAYIQNPRSFYLLGEIINIERIMFNRDRSECLKELGIEES